MRLSDRIIERLTQRTDSLLKKNKIWWIFGIFIVVLIIGYIVSYFFSPSSSHNNSDSSPGIGAIMRDIISFCGGIASIIGIAIALLQNVSTKDELGSVKQLAQTELDYEKELEQELKKANSQHEQEILKLKNELSKTQHIGILNRVASRISDSIRRLNDKNVEKNLEFLIWAFEEIYNEILQISYLINNWGFLEMESEVADQLKKFAINKNHINESKKKGVKGLKIEKITVELQEFHSTVVKLKTKLNVSLYGAKI